MNPYNPTNGRCCPIFITYLILFGCAVAYTHLYPNPVDWDGMERFNSAIILHDALRDALAGKFASFGEFAARLTWYKDTVRSGAGLVIWPPLQVALLTVGVFLFGKGYATVFAFSFAMLAVVVWATFSTLHRVGRLTPYTALLMGVFFTNPIFLHHIFTLNLRFGEILALALCVDIVARQVQAPRRAHLYAYAAVSVLAVFYRLTAVTVVVPAFFALCAATPRKRDWIGPLACIVAGAALFFGVHLLEKRLTGMSFIARMSESATGYAAPQGFYTFYEFSTYYKGLGSPALNALVATRYLLPVSKKFVFVASAFFCSGLVLFVPRRLHHLPRAPFWTLAGAVLLCIILFSLHGAKPDYLLPMLFGGFLLLACVTERPVRVLAPVALCAVIGWNLYATFSRDIHPYYEDINMTLFEEQTEALAGVRTIHVGFAPMKHVSHWALLHPGHAVREYSLPSEVVDLLRTMPEDALLVLNNGLDYRGVRLTAQAVGGVPNTPDVHVYPLRSTHSDYLLIRRIAPPAGQ